MDITLHQTAQLLADYHHDWAFCGGWAIDLFLNRVTREHKDVDIAVWRKDQRSIGKYLRRHGWTLDIAHLGELTRWDVDEYIDPPRHTIWCRNNDHDPDFVELLFNESNETHFIFRRDPSITLPLEDALIMTPSGYRILAPEVVLLYKSMDPENENNQADFDTAHPHLNETQRNWLRQSLQQRTSEHKWIEALT